MAKKPKIPKRLEKQYAFQKALWKDPGVVAIQEILDQGLEKYQRAWLAGQALASYGNLNSDNLKWAAKLSCDAADAVMAELKKREK